MKAPKIAIAVSMQANGTFRVEVLGISGDRVVASEPELESSQMVWGSACREMAELVSSINWRKARGLIEFDAPEPLPTVKVIS